MVMYGNGRSRLIRLLLSAAILSAVSAGAIAAARGPAESVPAAGYILRELDGFVAVYGAETGLREPLTVTEIELCSLPAADRETLRGGLPVPDREALLRLLEDLNS